MLYGVCTGPEYAGAFAEAGFDYIELHVQLQLRPEEPDAVFAAQLEQILAGPLPCPVANCFIPGHLKITGPAVDFTALTRYAAIACDRAQQAGIETIVFGSGGARNIPDGFDRTQAMDQLAAFARMAGDAAAQHAVTICVEPLNRGECNVLNTVAETAEFVRSIGHPHVKLVVDAYHWARNEEPADSIVAAAEFIDHVHIATYATRRAPGAEDCDFQPFYSALAATGYAGRISVECDWTERSVESVKAREVLKALG
jgi:sugar phosphate isomerase/epimerase